MPGGIRNAMTLRRILGALFALLLLAGLASVRRIGPRDQAVITSGGTARAVGPGVRFALPGLSRVTRYPAAPVTLTFPLPADTAGGRYAVYSNEGARLRVGLRLRYDLPREELVTFHRAARGAAPDSLVRPLLKAGLRRLAASRPAARLADADRAAWSRALAEALTPELAGAGARLVDVEFTTLAVTEEGRQAVALTRAADRGRRVVIIGVDAADWTIIDRLRATGDLPNFRKLVTEGASGPLRSIEPLLSPLIWTSIATGVGPEVHGILDFLIADPATGREVPATSRRRAAPALWNIAPAYGRSVGVVGWLATWPAEPVDGFIVTDRFGFLAYAGQAPAAGDGDVVYPPELLDGLGRLAVPSSQIDDATLRRFLDVTPAEIAAARRPGYEKGNRIGNFIHTLAAFETYAAIGLDLDRIRRPDLMMVYFEFIDATGHLFMAFEPPAREGIDPAGVKRFGGAIRAAYRHQDEVLGRFLAEAGDSAIVIVLSDHGFRSGQARLSGAADMEEANAARWHLPDGFLAMTGLGVRRGVNIARAGVLDIAPTVLALLGCPVPASMPGRVLTEAFDPGLFDPAALERVVSVRTVGYAPPDAASAPVAGGGGTSPGSGGAVSPAGDPRADANLGIVLVKQGRLDDAEVAFRRALAAAPRDRIVVNNLAGLCMKQQRFADAETILTALLERDPGYALGWSNLALCRQRLGRPAEALAGYDQALALEPADQRTLANRGFLLLDLKRPAEAERDFRAALAIESRQAGAHFGLGAALAAQGRTADARAELGRALEIDPGLARARELLDNLTR